jgi:hypothetical protein
MLQHWQAASSWKNGKLAHLNSQWVWRLNHIYTVKNIRETWIWKKQCVLDPDLDPGFWWTKIQKIYFEVIEEVRPFQVWLNLRAFLSKRKTFFPKRNKDPSAKAFRKRKIQKLSVFVCVSNSWISWKGEGRVGGLCVTTEYTEWQCPISGVHSIMMEKLAQAGNGGRSTPTPFHYIYHHVKSGGVRSSSEGRYAPHISILSLYVLCLVMSTMLKRRQNEASILASFSISKRDDPAYSRTCKDRSKANPAYSTH